MKKIFSSIFPSRTLSLGGGIASARDPKFYAVALLYLGAFIAFAHDGFFQVEGVFLYQQGIVTLLLAFVLAATLNWELYLFGRPAGANLVLQFIAIFPWALFLARILGDPTPQPLFPESSGLFADLLSTVEDFIHASGERFLPPWLVDIFANWKISLLAIICLFILSCRFLKLKLAGLIILLLIPLSQTLAAAPEPEFLLGSLLFLFGLSWQFCRYDKTIFFENVIASLQISNGIDEALLRVVLNTMQRLFAGNQKLSEAHFLQMVKDAYPSAAADDEEARALAAEITRKMVYSYNLVHIQGGSDGFFLLPNQRLYTYDSLLVSIAAVPRIVLMLITAVIWVLLPIDLIPDAIPFFGTLDDISVTILSTYVLKKSLNQE